MDINLTLLGQMITFAIFVWFTMKYVWPPIMKAISDRQNKIAAGLTAAEQGQQLLENAKEEIKAQLAEAKHEASQIIEQAHQRAMHIVEESKARARVEGDRLLQLAKGEVESEYSQAKEELIKQISNLIVQSVEKILGREVDKVSNDRLVAKLMSEI